MEPAAEAARIRRARPEESSSRPLGTGLESEFRVDLERLRFAPSFSRLAEVTQVVTSASTPGVVHNRLTHTIKVSAVARAIAVGLWSSADPDLLDALGGLNHVVAQAAAVAHDIGHPPFGHLGERVLDRLARTRFGLADGFEGNAQTFRIITELEVLGPGDEGLNLTTAVRAAVLKYPWGRFHWPDPHPSAWPEPPRGATPYRDRVDVAAAGAAAKFSAYVPDLAEMVDVLAAFPMVPPGRQTPECAVMDLADDIAYSLHDLDDFHRSGVLQFSLVSAELREWTSRRAELAALEAGELRARTRMPGAGLERLRRRLAGKDAWIFDEDAFTEAVATVGEEFVDGVLAVPHDGSMAAERALSGFTNQWIDRFVSSVRLVPDPPVRGATVTLTTLAWHQVALLKFVHQHFVLNRPDLAMQQRGQAAAVTSLVTAYDEWLSDTADAGRAPRRLVDLVETAAEGYRRTARERPEWLDHQTDESALTRMARGRAICDYVASLTDEQVVDQASRLRGDGGRLWSSGGV
ncbi:deoxyguanosinetriphosphate triphosphohydrolase family protein [Desertihabitans aurantiacus]|uniref:deoxyguanosinetriphosphate triphosphohydrolase family protein n=1 Tax=Desertihabitans aurantiacus TaxID=2282477 RepID=UPI000DF82FF6|nr:dNTP triphosphohydrolase [Desertihabitans aurantiacus]